MLVRLSVAVFSKNDTVKCCFPTPIGLILFFLEKFFCKTTPLFLFGKQFEIEGETGLLIQTKPQNNNPTLNPNPIFTMKNSKLIPALLLALASIFTLNAQEATPTFQDFLAQFPKATLPYTFNAEDLQSQLETRPAVKAARLDWAFYQFLPELERSASFSNKPVCPEPVAAFETKEYTAVLYNIARGFSRGTKTYSITVFSKNGQYLGTHFVAGVNPETLTVATIDEAMNASVNEYKVNWENNYRENGHIGNKVTGLTLVETATVELTTSGNPDKIEWSSLGVETSVGIAKIK